MKFQKIHFKKAYAPYQVSLLSMLKVFGIFAIYPVRGVPFLPVHDKNCHFHFTYVTPCVPKIDSPPSVIHHRIHAENVPVMCGEISSHPA